MRSILLAVMNLGKAVLALRTPRLQSSGAVRILWVQYNTDALYTSDWTDIANIWDGDVVMYTCTDATGENIILAFWY